MGHVIPLRRKAFKGSVKAILRNLGGRFLTVGAITARCRYTGDANKTLAMLRELEEEGFAELNNRGEWGYVQGGSA